MKRDFQSPRASAAALRRGMTVLLVVAFMGILSLILAAITGYVFQQARYGRAIFAREQALQIAEAGLEYYKWFLHPERNSSAMTTGVGIESPYTYIVHDPEGAAIGEADIVATPSMQCGRVQYIDIASMGSSYANPTFDRTISARYMKPSVAGYSNILNSNVWAGADRQITGPYHSNLGIRMDGTNNSTVTSAASSWSCTSSYGCSPTQTKPGIFGSGPNASLWSYPAASVDFAGMASDFPTLQSYAQGSGIYLSGTALYVGGAQQGGAHAAVGGSDQLGYRLVFNSGGTVTIYRVNATSWTWNKHTDNPNGPWYQDYFTVTSQSLLGTYAIPSGCSFIFSRAKTWVEGTISGKVTLVVADTGSYAPDTILNGNIAYQTSDGTTGFTLVSEKSIRFARVIPDVMSIKGIFVAQTGYFGRDLFDCEEAPYDKRTSLTLTGTIVSNLRVGTQWSYAFSWCPNENISGFLSRVEMYDRIQAFNPPPFTPAVSVDHRLHLWREE